MKKATDAVTPRRLLIDLLDIFLSWDLDMQEMSGLNFQEQIPYKQCIIMVSPIKNMLYCLNGIFENVKMSRQKQSELFSVWLLDIRHQLDEIYSCHPDRGITQMMDNLIDSTYNVAYKYLNTFYSYNEKIRK